METYDWKQMEQAGIALIAASNELQAAANEVRGVVNRSGCQGPIFSEMEKQMRGTAEKIAMGSRGLHTVGARLKADAPAAHAAYLKSLTQPDPVAQPSPRR